MQSIQTYLQISGNNYSGLAELMTQNLFSQIEHISWNYLFLPTNSKGYVRFMKRSYGTSVLLELSNCYLFFRSVNRSERLYSLSFFIPTKYLKMSWIPVWIHWQQSSLIMVCFLWRRPITGWKKNIPRKSARWIVEYIFYLHGIIHCKHRI